MALREDMTTKSNFNFYKILSKAFIISKGISSVWLIFRSKKSADSIPFEGILLIDSTSKPKSLTLALIFLFKIG